MRTHPQEAVAMGGGKTLDEIVANRKLQLALTRLVEIDGEAAAGISQETRLRHPEVPWPEMTT